MAAQIMASSIIFIVFLVICTLIYYLINFKNLKKSRKYYEELHRSLAPGKSIEFCGGIKAKVISVKGDEAEVKVSGGATMTISRYIITKIEE
ncbi:MAG: preprotein translocase subunit YajC [Johnsonella sp.]|nr:preprotein translocase subunit YajC [Johnsonella sp.]